MLSISKLAAPVAASSQIVTQCPADLSLIQNMHICTKHGIGRDYYLTYNKKIKLPDASLRRLKSSGESFELDLATTLSKLDTVSFSDSMVMAIPEDPNVDRVSAEVGHTHLTKHREEKINLVNVKGKCFRQFQ